MEITTLSRLTTFEDVSAYLCEGYCHARANDIGWNIMFHLPTLERAAQGGEPDQIIKVEGEIFNVYKLEDEDGDIITVVTNGEYTTGITENSLDDLEETPFTKASPSEVLDRIKNDLGR